MGETVDEKQPCVDKQRMEPPKKIEHINCGECTFIDRHFVLVVHKLPTPRRMPLLPFQSRFVDLVPMRSYRRISGLATRAPGVRYLTVRDAPIPQAIVDFQKLVAPVLRDADNLTNPNPDPSNDMLFPISEESVQSFRREGFLVVRNIFNPVALGLYKELLMTEVELRKVNPVPIFKESSPVRAMSKVEKKRVDDPEPFNIEKPVYPEEMRPSDGAGQSSSGSVGGGNQNEKGDVASSTETPAKESKPPLDPNYKKGTLRIPLKCFKSKKAKESFLKHLQRLQNRRLRTFGMQSPPVEQASMPDAMKTADNQAERIQESDAFKARIREVSNGAEIEAFFENMSRTTYQLHTHEPVTRSIVKSGFGAVIGRCCAELGGFLRARLFSDSVIVRPKWSNAFAFTNDIMSVNFSDNRGVAAQVVLPGAPGVLGKSSTKVIIARSHHVMNEVTDKGKDMLYFRQIPPSWDTGEWVRTNPRHEDIRMLPIVSLELHPGDVLFTNLSVLHAWSPHMGTTADCPVFHNWFVMPDGATFNGARHMWMSAHEKGPLWKYEPGRPLQDEKLFPLIYSMPEAEE